MADSHSDGDDEVKSMVKTELAKEEHLRLAGIIKGVHADLRKKFHSSRLITCVYLFIYLHIALNSFEL
jgi:hypothetical protein